MKSKIKATVVADSINKYGDRITTMEVVFPRFILAELATHRVFSMNSASSRAIPYRKMRKMVLNDPFIPIAWQKEHTGMQGTEYITNESDITNLKIEWLKARNEAINQADAISRLGATKQLCNRLLEPFMWHKVLITSTDFENFFSLRCPKYDLTEDNSHSYRSKKDYFKDYGDAGLTYTEWLLYNKGQAEIHIMELAESMLDAMNESKPTKLNSGQWHVPYGDNIDYVKLGAETTAHYELNPNEEINVDKWALKVSTARCARLSYQTVGDNPKIDYGADIRLHDILLDSKHMSPFEHCAQAVGGIDDLIVRNDRRSRNLKGFIQYREIVESY